MQICATCNIAGNDRLEQDNGKPPTFAVMAAAPSVLHSHSIKVLHALHVCCTSHTAKKVSATASTSCEARSAGGMSKPGTCGCRYGRPGGVGGDRAHAACQPDGQPNHTQLNRKTAEVTSEAAVTRTCNASLGVHASNTVSCKPHPGHKQTSGTAHAVQGAVPAQPLLLFVGASAVKVRG